MKTQTHKDFIRWAELAANAEQSGNLKLAADFWQKASAFARNKANQNTAYRWLIQNRLGQHRFSGLSWPVEQA